MAFARRVDSVLHGCNGIVTPLHGLASGERLGFAEDPESRTPARARPVAAASRLRTHCKASPITASLLIRFTMNYTVCLPKVVAMPMFELETRPLSQVEGRAARRVVVFPFDERLDVPKV